MSLSNVFHVRRAYLDQMPKVREPTRRQGRVGGHVTLTCSEPHSLPKAQVFWTHEGEDAGFEEMDMTESLAKDPMVRVRAYVRVRARTCVALGLNEWLCKSEFVAIVANYLGPSCFERSKRKDDRKKYYDKRNDRIREKGQVKKSQM